jgi:hypothetical protein
MTSTLLISAFDIPAASLYISPAAAADEDLNEWNLQAPNRYSLFQFNAAAASNSIRHDLGSAVTKSVDHLIIARADMLKTAGVTSITLSGGSDGATFGTTAHTNASFASATLYGPRSNDYVTEIATTSALRWWKMAYVATSTKFPHSKLSFGSFFDFGCDVGSYSIDRIPAKEARFYTDAGSQYQSRVSEEIYKFTMTWNKVTVAKMTTFMSTIARYAHRLPVFLYTTTAGNRHELLDSQRLIHARIVPESIQRKDAHYDRQQITIEFQELLG